MTQVPYLGSCKCSASDSDLACRCSALDLACICSAIDLACRCSALNLACRCSALNLACRCSAIDLACICSALDSDLACKCSASDSDLACRCSALDLACICSALDLDLACKCSALDSDLVKIQEFQCFFQMVRIYIYWKVIKKEISHLHIYKYGSALSYAHLISLIVILQGKYILEIYFLYINYIPLHISLIQSLLIIDV
jgi:hypothetical protein